MVFHAKTGFTQPVRATISKATPITSTAHTHYLTGGSRRNIGETKGLGLNSGNTLNWRTNSDGYPRFGEGYPPLNTRCC